MASSNLEKMKDEEGRSSSEETGYGSDLCAPDDSEEDPTFDIVEETRLSLSKICIKKSKPRSRSKGDGTKSEQEEEEEEEVLEAQEVQIPELDAKDLKCFEVVEKLIKDGLLDKLKVDQCKVYLRKYGLRLTGKKDTLLARIKEHLEVKDGGGEKMYPVSSFIHNCKGDACSGDVVMFEQKVYENFNIASRSAAPLGTRIVAGRIVKDSYGKTKQQHTFTVEVLWSKGVKPWPPLHPFLIKGRNLYGSSTMRQKWKDEQEREKSIEEKHSRGFVARHLKKNRLQHRERRNKGRMKSMKENKSNEGQKHQKVCQLKPDSVQQENTQCQQQPKGQLGPVRSQVLNKHNFTDYALETQVNGWNVFGKSFGPSIKKTLQPHTILSEQQSYHQPSALVKQTDAADGILKSRATAPAQVFDPLRLAPTLHHNVQLHQQTQNCYSVLKILKQSEISLPNMVNISRQCGRPASFTHNASSDPIWKQNRSSFQVHHDHHRGLNSQKNEFSDSGTYGFPAKHHQKYRPPTSPRNSSDFQAHHDDYRGLNSQKNEFSDTGTYGFPAKHHHKYRQPTPPRNSSGFHVHHDDHRGLNSQKNEFSDTDTYSFPAKHHHKYRPPTPPRHSSGFQSNKSILGRYTGENDLRCRSPPPRRQPFASPPRMHYPAQQRQSCRYYRKNRCYFGEDCKFSHDDYTE